MEEIKNREIILLINLYATITFEIVSDIRTSK